jgi:hypothetical protein
VIEYHFIKNELCVRDLHKAESLKNKYLKWTSQNFLKEYSLKKINLMKVNLTSLWNSKIIINYYYVYKFSITLAPHMLPVVVVLAF